MPYHRSAMPVMNAAADGPRRRLTILAAVTLALGLLALAAPLGGSESPASRVGALLGIAATLEALHSARRSTAAARRRGTASALISMAIALFLINAPFVAGQALRIVIAAWFAVDAVRYAIGAVRAGDRRERAAGGARGVAAMPPAFC